ncbi:hypothetical protein C455_08052 [Haloferax larsenii JCM 13917]|nr:DUF58 domain-containing protein [Haloferax larsenii]ELZ79521.1 hypothetical protein C455_08052 [Haloferax larsenii JCM 13917]
MRPTLRGWAALVVVALGVGNAVAFGPRALDAVVVPVVVALVVGAVQVWRISPPRAVRSSPEDGFPGETHTVTLDIESNRPFPATTTDALSDGLDGDSNTQSLVGGGTISYDVAYQSRGLATIGPASIVATDILGFFTRTFTVGGTTEILVYPRLRSLSATARRDLSLLSHFGASDERGEFDRLRPYVPGDSLRDVHWKSTARSGNLVVKAFADHADPDAVAVSVGSIEGRVDDVAEATASLCWSLLDAGVPIHLTSPGGTIDAAPGDQRHVLAHLAQMDAGSVPDENAGVVVRGDVGQTHIAFGGHETTFERLSADPSASDEMLSSLQLDDDARREATA